MIYLKVQENEYPAYISGRLIDRDWDGRASKSITLTMTHAQAAQLFTDGLGWSIVQRETVPDGTDGGGTETVQEWDNAGLQNNINHAAAANVFKDSGWRPTISAIAKIENILTERTTEGESPVKKAKAHNRIRRRTERITLPIFPLRAIGFRDRKSHV